MDVWSRAASSMASISPGSASATEIGRRGMTPTSNRKRIVL